MHGQVSREAPTAGEAIEGGDDEATLVARAKCDRQAFAPLYARYVGPVYAYCYRRLGNRESAEDATSQVFYKAMAALPGYRYGLFGAWLFAIAHNVVADARRGTTPDAPLDMAIDPVDLAPTPEEIVLAAEGRRTLLACLPPDQRRVVELRLIGLSGAEIARALGRSRGAVKMLQLRAVERLRQAHGREAQERVTGSAR